MTDLVTFERAAYSRAPDRADLLYAALRAFVVGSLVENAAQPDSKPAADAMMRRLASAIAAVMADPEVRLSSEQTDQLFALGPDLVRLLTLAFGNSDFLLRALAGSDRISGAVLQARLPLIALDTDIGWPPEFLASLLPRQGQQALAQLIASKPIMSPRA